MHDMTKLSFNLFFQAVGSICIPICYLLPDYINSHNFLCILKIQTIQMDLVKPWEHTSLSAIVALMRFRWPQKRINIFVDKLIPLLNASEKRQFNTTSLTHSVFYYKPYYRNIFLRIMNPKQWFALLYLFYFSYYPILNQITRYP